MRGAARTDPPASSPTGLSRELLSFAVIGGLALFVDMGALWVALNLLHLGVYAGGLFSYLIAATCTWYLNRTFTFHGVSRRRAWLQWAKFLAANGVGAAVNYAVYAAVVTLGPPLVPWPALTLPLLPYLAKAAGSLSGMVFNFFASKFLVFRKA